MAEGVQRQSLVSAFGGLQSRAERAFYPAAKDALMRHRERFPLLTSPDAACSVLGAVLDDCPELFWFEGVWRLGERGGCQCVIPSYNCSAVDAAGRADELDRVAAQLIANHGSENPKEAALAMFDWMVENVRYGIVAGRGAGQTAYEALVQRAAVCKGMAKGYQLLLARMGIPCVLAKGSISGVGRHVWNVVFDGERAQHVDVSLAHSEFDHLFPVAERGNPRRCFLMSESKVREYGLVEQD